MDGWMDSVHVCLGTAWRNTIGCFSGWIKSCHRISKFLGCHHIVDREGRNKTKNQSISTMWKEGGAWGLGETRGCRCLPCCFSWWDVKKRAPAVAAYGIQPPPHLYVSFTTVYSGRETKLLPAVQKNLIKIFHCVCEVQEVLLFSPSNTAADKVASYTILVLHLCGCTNTADRVVV